MPKNRFVLVAVKYFEQSLLYAATLEEESMWFYFVFFPSTSSECSEFIVENKDEKQAIITIRTPGAGRNLSGMVRIGSWS